MATRLPASQRTREELAALIEGHLSTASAKDELVKLATRLIVEEALEGEAGDTIGRDYYEHGAQPGQGYRNGSRTGRLKTAEGLMEYSAPQIAGRAEPFRSAIREHLKGHTQGLVFRALPASAAWRIACATWRPRCRKTCGRSSRSARRRPIRHQAGPFHASLRPGSLPTMAASTTARLPASWTTSKPVLPTCDSR